MNLEEYWETIPTGRENSMTYAELCDLWGTDKRRARNILHRLSEVDDGGDYVLIRTSAQRGFYKTNDREEIERYKQEIKSRAMNTFAPLKKINRILGDEECQITMDLK